MYELREDYYDTLPEYKGDKTFYMDGFSDEIIAIFHFIGGFVSVLFFINIFYPFTGPSFTGIYNAVSVALMLLSMVISNLFSFDKIIVNDEGIKFESAEIKKGTCREPKYTQFFTWDEIQTIGISPLVKGKFPPQTYFYFSTVAVDKDKKLKFFDKYPTMIKIRYNPKAVHCTLKYWDKEIQNLEGNEKWNKYVSRL